MKNYSFSNIAAEDSLLKNSTELNAYYRHSELMAQQANQRIEEIKKKYDTPSRRQRVDNLKKSQDLQFQTKRNEESKENPFQERSKDSLLQQRSKPQIQDRYQHRPVPTFGPNPLKESFAVNRLEKSTLRNDVQSKQLDNFRKESRGYNTNFQGTSKEDEEALFSKVREMKQSLISKDYMRSSINPKGSTNSIRQNQQNCRQFDPRVENIDKINAKIKQILSCLENEKNPSKYVRESPKKSYLKESDITPPQERSIKKSYLKQQTRSLARDSVIVNPDTRGSYIFNKTPIGQIDKTNSGVRQQNQFQSQFEGQKSYQNNEEISFEEKKELSVKKENLILKYQQQYSRTPVMKHLEQKVPLQVSRSRSQVAFSTSNRDDTLKSGKKLNEEISRIQSKIEAMEREKKKLNIEFTPFSNKNRSTSVLHTATHYQNSIDSQKEKIETENKSSIPHFRTSSSTKDRIFSSQFGRFSEQPELKIKEDKKEREEAQPEKSLQQVDVEIKTLRIDKQDGPIEEDNVFNSENSSQFREDYSDFKRRTDEGIEQRKKRLQSSNSDIIRTDSLKKLVSLFCQQAKLDQTFRNMKIWLEEIIDKEKYIKIAALLKSKGRQLTPEETETLFELNQSENNPFFSIQSGQGTFESAISAYIQAETHWIERISHQFSKENLISEGFTKTKMDLQRKGFIQLQDLVRLLNIESGTFYRNRDIFLIFKRLTGKEKASFQDLLQGLCP